MVINHSEVVTWTRGERAMEINLGVVGIDGSDNGWVEERSVVGKDKGYEGWRRARP